MADTGGYLVLSQEKKKKKKLKKIRAKNLVIEKKNHIQK